MRLIRLAPRAMDDWVGKEISHYRIHGQLGRGGMGEVFLAEDLNIGRTVVLKVLRDDLAGDPHTEERFRREARACASVSHPNISIIYEVDRHEGLWFICMEYVQGRTLRAMLREQGVLPLAEAVRIAVQTADALAAAHDRGIVHRDVKPENLMLTAMGQVKVLDFGLAVFTSRLLQPLEVAAMETGGDRLTVQGVAVGTLHYMSPEQTKGHAVTPASDVFSLGAILYETLAGVPPFRGDNQLAVMHAIAYEDPPALLQRRPDAPAALDALIRRALSKEPSARYPTARPVLEALQALAIAPVPATPSRLPPEEAKSRQATSSQRSDDMVGGPLDSRFDAALVGRDRELRQLWGHFERAAGGEGALVLVAGEAGIGKTRLVGELSRRAGARGALCLQGRCLFREGSLPYHPFVEAAGRLIASLGLHDPQAFEGYVRERLPALAGRLPILRSFLHVGTQESAALIADKEHLLDGISALFLAFARERPMVVHVDDLHWADEASLDLLLYLARNCRSSQGLIVGTYRPEELTRESAAEHPLGRMLGRMSAGDHYHEVELSRLGAGETAEMVRSALGGAALDAAFLNLLHAETAGNPFYVIETLKLLAEDGTLRRGESDRWTLAQAVERVTIPGRVHDVVTRRIGRLAAADREVLEIAACEGMVFRSDVIASSLNVRRIQVLGALQRAEKEHRLIHAERDSYTFDHPLIREVLYEEIIPELRREYHGLIGAFLAGNRRGRPGEAGAIAYQHLEAGQEEEALPFLLEAGKRARHLYANAEALSHLDRAETILGRLVDACRRSRAPLTAERVQQSLRLFKERGRLHQRLGDHDRAMSDFLAMQRAATDGGLRDRQAHALSLMADLYASMGEYEQAFDRARQAHDLALEAGDKHSLSSALRVMGAVRFYRGEYDEALAAHNRSIELQKEIDDLAGYAENLNKVGNIHLFRGDRDKAEAVYAAALTLARQSANRLAEAEALNNLGVLFYYGGEADVALEHFEQCLALKREIGDRRSLARSLNNVALVFEMRGELEGALSTHLESLALLRDISDQGSIISGLNNLANVYEKMGRYGEALAAGQESLTTSEAIGDRLGAPYALNSLGRIRLWLNEPEEAERLFVRALEMTQRQGQRGEQCQSMQNLAAARAALRRTEEALQLLAQARELSQELKVKEREAEVLHLLGILQAERGDLSAAESCARDLEALAATLKLREVDIRRLHLQGRAALARGDPGRETAARLLAEAAESAAQVGLKELEWRLRHELAEALGPGSEAEAQITRAAAIIERLATQAGSPEQARVYLMEPVRSKVLQVASRLRPAHDNSSTNRTDSN